MRNFLVLLLFISFSSAAKKYPWEWLKEPEFLMSYLNVIKNSDVEPWVKNLGGPSTPSELVSFFGEEWHHIKSCKPHDCGNKNITVLYNSQSKSLYSLLHSEGVKYFGSPNSQVIELLNKLHKQAFVQSNIASN